MFFYNEQELKQYVDVNASFDFELLKPKLKQVDRDVLKLYFGYAFIDSIQSLYDGVTNGNISTLTPAQQKAINLFRAISAPLAISLWITPGQIQIDNAGIYIATNANRKTAFEWQINNLIKSYLKPAYQALEEAIEVLALNIADYQLYASFDEYTYYKKCFIKNSRDFTKLYSPLNNSFMSYLMLRSCMDKVDELDIKSVLLPNYYQGLKTRLLSGTLTPSDNAVIPFIKKALANLTIYKAISELSVTFDKHGFMEFDNTSGVKSGESKKTAKGETVIRLSQSLLVSGNTYLNELKKYLETNKQSYPEYTSDPAYKSDQSAVIVNSNDQNYFIGM